jgi:hypothetical protein
VSNWNKFLYWFGITDSHPMDCGCDYSRDQGRYCGCDCGCGCDWSVAATSPKHHTKSYALRHNIVYLRVFRVYIDSMTISTTTRPWHQEENAVQDTQRQHRRVFAVVLCDYFHGTNRRRKRCVQTPFHLTAYVPCFPFVKSSSPTRW